MALITSANFANAVVTLFASQALEPLQANLVMGQLINRAYDSTPGSVGSTVNIPVPSTTVTTNNLAEGGSITLQASNLTNAQVVVNKNVESSFTIPDMSQAFTNVDLMNVYMQPAIVAVAEQIESDIMGLYTTLTVNTPVGAQGSALTSAAIDAAETALFNAKVTETQKRILVVTPAQYTTLRSLPEFSNKYQIGLESQALTDGALGKIKGFEVFRSQKVKSVGVGSPVVTTNYGMGFAKDAFCLVTRALPNPGPGLGVAVANISLGNFTMRMVYSYNPLTQANVFTVQCLYGVAALRPSFGVQVIT